MWGLLSHLHSLTAIKTPSHYPLWHTVVTFELAWELPCFPQKAYQAGNNFIYTSLVHVWYDRFPHLNKILGAHPPPQGGYSTHPLICDGISYFYSSRPLVNYQTIEPQRNCWRSAQRTEKVRYRHCSDTSVIWKKLNAFCKVALQKYLKATTRRNKQTYKQTEKPRICMEWFHTSSNLPCLPENKT